MAGLSPSSALSPARTPRATSHRMTGQHTHPPPVLTWRHTGRRHFMYCRMPAHTSERFEGGRRTRIVACTGPQPTGASLLALRGRFMAATAPKSHVSGFSASWQLIERCCHTARSFFVSRCWKKNSVTRGRPTAKRGCSRRSGRGLGDPSATPQHRHHHFAASAELTSNTTKNSILSIIST